MTDREGRELLVHLMENADCKDAFACLFGMTGTNQKGEFGCFARYPHGDPEEEDRGCIAHQVAQVLKAANEIIDVHEAGLESPHVMRAEEIRLLPAQTIVWIEYFNGETGTSESMIAGMKCSDGQVVAEDGCMFDDFKNDMTPDEEGNRFRFWIGKPTEKYRKDVPWK